MRVAKNLGPIAPDAPRRKELAAKRLLAMVLLLALGNSGFLFPAPGHASMITSKGELSGSLNGSPMSGKFTASGDSDTGAGSVTVTGLSDEQASSLSVVDGIFGWFFRSTAKSLGGAPNLLDMTGGDFVYKAQFEFETGERITATAVSVATGPKATEVSMAVDGNIPMFADFGAIAIEDFAEKWEQQLELDMITIRTKRQLAIMGLRNTLQGQAQIIAQLSEVTRHLHQQALNTIRKFGSDLTFEQTRVASIPEPGSLTLFAIGIAGLGFFGWRRRRA